VTLYLAALAVLLAGGLAALVLHRRPSLALGVATGAAVAGCAMGLAAVSPHLLGGAASDLLVPWSEPLGAFHLRIDALSAVFQVALFVLGIATAVFGAGYMARDRGRRSLAGFLFFFDVEIAALSLVLAAADGVLFLVAWEVMTVAAFVLVTFDDDREPVRRAGYTFLVASHIGTGFLFALFLLLGRGAGSFDFLRFEALRGAVPMPGLLFALGVVGFGTKAGLFPLHVWLPEAHPAAPSHVSALLSAVMIKTGVYGVLRLLGFLPPAPLAWGLVLAGVGMASALVAITLALGQGNVKRSLAYSSVENVGLVFLGIGLGVAAGASGMPVVAALGLAGALFHVWSHALMKGLAFLGAGVLGHAAHSLDLERMGGLLARLPVSGAAMLVGLGSLAALPPLSGFASEWMLYLGLLLAGQAGPGAGALLAWLAVAAVALVGTLAAVTFTRIAGVALLGAPRSPEAAHAHEPGALERLPLVVLAAACVVLGVFPGIPLHFLRAAVVQVGGPALVPALAEATARTLPPQASATLAAVAAVLLGLLARRLRARRPVTSSETWGCGFARPTTRMEYTASSYAQLLLGGMVPRTLRPRIHLRPPRGVFPGPASMRTEADDPARTRLFDPAFRRFGERMSRLRRFQAQRLHLQLLYTLLALLALGAGLALRGGWR
jgi:formate hydrogenlyase subunit 3/multisubunit Na+/H+ antiporter MnhD subunit